MVEAPGIEFQWFAIKKCLFALATDGVVREPRLQQAIDGVAMRADKMNAVGHGQLQISDKIDMVSAVREIKSERRI